MLFSDIFDAEVFGGCLKSNEYLCVSCLKIMPIGDANY